MDNPLPLDEDNAEERQEKLPQDNDQPFSLPDDVQETVPDTNQVVDDSDADAHQAYDEGLDNAAGVEDNSSQNAVEDYNPRRSRTAAKRACKNY